jgi:hypothetical protein
MITTINVTGLGGVIDSEVAIIAFTLKSLGYKVEVKNLTGITGTPEEFERLSKNVKNTKVLIEATHIPWGG